MKILTFIAVVSLGCSGSSDSGDSEPRDSSSTPIDTALVADGSMNTDTSAIDSATITETTGADVTAPDCAAPGGPKCKAGTACVPKVAGSTLLTEHHCAEPNGDLGGGCLPACMGASRCKAGSCFTYAKTGAETCGFFCDLDADCKTPGICCKKTPDVKCVDGACVGGSCPKSGMCAPC